MAAYRRAWAFFYLGRHQEAANAAIEILSKPELMIKKDGKVHPQFISELSRDLATFMVGYEKALPSTLYQHSPQDLKLANVEFLASELMRLKQRKRAMEAYLFVVSRARQPRKQLELYAYLVSLQEIPQSISSFEKAISLWKASSCESGCEELKRRLRAFVLNLNASEQKAPSKNLIAVYQAYLSVFSTELDMLTWYAQARHLRKEIQLAYPVYGRVLAQFLSQRKVKKAKKEEIKEREKRIESLLFLRVELAEQLMEMAEKKA